jgi:DNA-directed RNA polymerase specialized sigma24 family protein
MNHRSRAHVAMDHFRVQMVGHRRVYRARDGDAYSDPPQFRHYESLIAYIEELERAVELAADLERAAAREHEGHGYTVWRIGGRQFVPLDEADEAVRRAREK